MIYIVFFGSPKIPSASLQRVEAIKQVLTQDFDVKILANTFVAKKYRTIINFFKRYQIFLQKIIISIKKKRPNYIILYNQDPILFLFLFFLSKIKKITFISQISEKHKWGDYNYSLGAYNFFFEKIFFIFLKIFPCKLIVISDYLKKIKPKNSFLLPGILPYKKCNSVFKKSLKNNLLYIGRGDPRDDIKTMVLSFKKFAINKKYKKINFFMVGLKNSALLNVKKLLKEFNIKNVKIFGFINERKLQIITNKSKVFLLCRDNSTSVHACFPTRAAELLLQKKILITTPHLTLNKYAKISRQIRIVPEKNVDQTASALKKVISQRYTTNQKSFKKIRKLFLPISYSLDLQKFLKGKKKI